jgi:hypothetical protein
MTAGCREYALVSGVGVSDNSAKVPRTRPKTYAHAVLRDSDSTCTYTVIILVIIGRTYRNYIVYYELLTISLTIMHPNDYFSLLHKHVLCRLCCKQHT